MVLIYTNRVNGREFCDKYFIIVKKNYLAIYGDPLFYLYIYEFENDSEAEMCAKNVYINNTDIIFPQSPVFFEKISFKGHYVKVNGFYMRLSVTKKTIRDANRILKLKILSKENNLQLKTVK